MLEIHLYGTLKKKFDSNASFAEDTIINLPYVENERILQLLERLDIQLRECGEIFCNGIVATENTLIPEGARIGVFSTGMHLLCGGQHLKGHGFITKSPTQKDQYY
ncbi:MAG: hypothetical protein JSW11_16040 [Candidatus Heimdallarchaeota archaeon]|nr:MAG: hypothetical protein JSW11_16040 [Candidatus Heimdallarchaeota archaeon]